MKVQKMLDLVDSEHYKIRKTLDVDIGFYQKNIQNEIKM